MKKILAPVAVACALLAQAQTPVTISTSQSADEVWYSLLNGEVGRAPLAEWDLAFEMTGFTAGVRVNTAKGTVVYETAYTFDQWDQLTAPDPGSWTEVNNAVERWDFGALNHGNNMDLPEGVNVGWGDYSVVTHNMIGNKVYALEMPDQSWKKLRINYMISGVFDFTYSNIDGSNEQNGQVNKTQFAGKNFAYWSFSTNATLNREPLSSSWDLVFTKYTDFVPTPYPVAGVLQNRLVTALQVDGVPTDQAQWWGGPFSTDINILGSDWKTYDSNAHMYTIAADRSYFVKDRAGNIWKIIFTGYGSGNFSFTQEMVSAVGVNETALSATSVAVYPNPATPGQVEVKLPAGLGAATLRVFNMAGQQLAEQRFTGLEAAPQRTLATADWAPGLYTLRLETAHGTAATKLVLH